MEAMNFNDDKPAGWGRLADFLNSAPKYEKMAQTIEKMKKMKELEESITNHKHADFILQNEGVFNAFLK